VAGYVDNVINTAHEPEIAVFVFYCSVTGEVEAGLLYKVGIEEPLRLGKKASHHAGPWSCNAELALFVDGWVHCRQIAR
jgi:uncharacterized membrane protein YGL010W